MIKKLLFVAALVAMLQLGAAQGQEECTPGFKPNSLYVECGCTDDSLEQIKEELKDLKEDLVSLRREILLNHNITQQYLAKEYECRGLLGKNIECAASSCKQILDGDLTAPSNNYLVKACDYCIPNEVYCDFTMTCGGTKGWMKVADMDMSDFSQECPSAWRLITSPKRQCGKRTGRSCDSVTFSTSNIKYQKVCGRVTGYPHRTPDAFDTTRDICSGGCSSINQPYVDGVSITHGTPRTHIWSFAALQYVPQLCPCSSPTQRPQTPTFVGSDYYCERGNTNDPLWDGQNCEAVEIPCCDNPNLPMFVKYLPETTGDDIEVRLCVDQDLTDEDVRIELLELYVQ